MHGGAEDPDYVDLDAIDPVIAAEIREAIADYKDALAVCVEMAKEEEKVENSLYAIATLPAIQEHERRPPRPS